MKCKQCGREVCSEDLVCPGCGAPLSDRHLRTKRNGRARIWKTVLISLAITFLVLCLSIVIYWGVIGVTSFEEGVQSIVKLLTPKENDVFFKKSYSVSDEKAVKQSDVVVGTMGNVKLTNGQLQVFYWMNVYEYLEQNSYYAMYSGLDYAEPLDQQTCTEIGGTWQQYFLKQAVSEWQHYQALALVAEAEGFQLSDAVREELSNLRATMTQTALDEGISSLNALVQADFGPGCSFEDYENYMRIYYTGFSYLSSQLDALNVSNDELEKYYEAHSAALETQGIRKENGDVMDVRHILIGVEGGKEDENGEMIYTDAEWEACRQEAQRILDEWLKNDPTEETFSQYAVLYSMDEGSNANGGLYTSLDESSGFVEEFVDWYMDDSRKAGDYGLIKTDYGYHVMYFSGAEEQWVRSCRELLLTEKGEEIINNAAQRYPSEIKYKKIALGIVDINPGG